MKTATLAALIFTALDLLTTVARDALTLLHGQEPRTAMLIGSYAVSILFFAGLFYFLLVFYKSQKA